MTAEQKRQIAFFHEKFDCMERIPDECAEKLFEIIHAAGLEALSLLADAHIRFVSTGARMELDRRFKG